MEREVTVILVDDDQSVRDGLKWLIESVDLHVEMKFRKFSGRW